MSRKGLSMARLTTIYKRQQDPLWDSSYVPGILATPQEAPSISHAVILTPQKLAYRGTHLLSLAELNAALLGLYHPDVIGLQEQRLLSPDETVHPLWNHSDADRSSLPPLKGLIAVAERLDLLEYLPRIYSPHPDHPGQRITLVYPWLGDLLWAIRQPDGPVTCINWTVKGKRQDFNRPLPNRYGRIRPSSASPVVLARHELEAAYYADAGIRTIAIAGEDIDHHLAANLRQLFLHHRLQLDLTLGQRTEILDKYRAAQAQDITPAEVIAVFKERGRYSVHQSRSVFFQAIWSRELRIDLFSPILINRPMRPESRDAIEVYADFWRTAA